MYLKPDVNKGLDLTVDEQRVLVTWLMRDWEFLGPDLMGLLDGIAKRQRDAGVD